jgi:hypothetical protein
MAVLIFVIVFFVLFLICAIGILILSAIPMILDNIAEIKEKWRELKDKGGVE